MNKYVKNISLIVGIILILLLTFYLWKDYANYKNYVHYHANFWVFIDWKQVDFSDEKYMEDIAACKFWTLKTQKERTHLHENNGWTIHVHDDWVTWGHFFANIWYEFNDNFLATDNSWLLIPNNDTKITFILNWKAVWNPFNREIKSEDVLLVNYWNENIDTINNYYSQIKKDAWEFNEMKDPTTCSWDNFSIFKEVTDFFHHDEH